MNSNAIILIVWGSWIAGILILLCSWEIGRKRKRLPATSHAGTSAPRRPSYDDVEKGQCSAIRDGGMVVLGATAAVAAATSAAEAVVGDGGDSETGGGDGGGSDGGGCGGGGCSGCGGGCGGCGGGGD
ncbi:uncharacterized protein [Coffea arabica]|mgnify:CR=1 FL=1|uniref:Uncharacterized protein n=1 Tax=Coffea arabica TaxID=13443 RepID=A0A6P6SBB8_COFAR|nr:keratin-associated protein 5-4-like [Coffea arabica]XP_027063146.1 keratin-associated protein 5-4-like [Coffea arabica]